MTFNLFLTLHRGVAAGVVSAVLLATLPAAAAPAASDGYSQRLVTEFLPLVGNRETTEALVSSLLRGQATSGYGAPSVAPATGPLSYGDARLALKMAQGQLAQAGVDQPSSEQLQAALHGGTLDTAQGPKPLAGVLPQRVQGVSWATLAQGAGLSVEDLIPPSSVTPKKTSARQAVKVKPPGKTSGKKASASTARKLPKSSKSKSKSRAKASAAGSKAKTPLKKR